MCAAPSRSSSMCACAWPSRSAATSCTTASSASCRLGNQWDLAFHQALKRDAKGDVIEFDIDPRLVEQFATEATKVIREKMDQGEIFALVAAPDARPYVRMMIERIFVNLPVLSHLEIARGVDIRTARLDLVSIELSDLVLSLFLIFCRDRRLPAADAGLSRRRACRCRCACSWPSRSRSPCRRRSCRPCSRWSPRRTTTAVWG